MMSYRLLTALPRSGRVVEWLGRVRGVRKVVCANLVGSYAAAAAVLRRQDVLAPGRRGRPGEGEVRAPELGRATGERATLRIPRSPVHREFIFRASAAAASAAASAGRLGSRHKAGTSDTRTFPPAPMAVFSKGTLALKIPETLLEAIMQLP